MAQRRLSAFLGVHKLPDRAQQFIHKVVISSMLYDLVFWLSQAFFVLFVIDIVGLEQLGILLAISVLIQAIMDYPSGVLGDWIGQKWVLFIGCLVEAIAYGALIFAHSFSSLLVIYVLRAIAYSQQSGAIFTWLDNNYKVAAGEADPERKTYRLFRGRWNIFWFLVPAISSIIGGILVSFYFREIIFAIQAIGMGFGAIMFLVLVKDFPEIDRPKRSVRNYFKLLGDGLRFVCTSKVMLLLMAGICLDIAAATIWIEMILYPLHFGYTGSDAGTNVFRAATLIVAVPATIYAAKLATKLDIKWYSWLMFAGTSLFFGSLALLTNWFPIDKNIFEPIAIAITLIIYVGGRLFALTGDILQQRIFLDLVPDQNRNSIYSLIPTLVCLVTAPGFIIGGMLLTNFGVSFTLFLLSLIGTLALLFNYTAIRFIPSGSLDSQKPAI